MDLLVRWHTRVRHFIIAHRALHRLSRWLINGALGQRNFCCHLLVLDEICGYRSSL
jgi:hypothetical protein